MSHALKAPVTQSLLTRIATGTLVATLAITGSATFAPPPLLAAGAAQQENGALLLAIGESRVINLADNLSDVVIADPAVLDVHVRSQRQIYLIAKGPGETNVFVTSGNGKMLYANAVRVGNNIRCSRSPCRTPRSRSAQ